MRDAGQERVSLIYLLGVMSISFAIGWIPIMIHPGLAGDTWGVGFFFNVALVVSYGAVLGWSDRTRSVLPTALFGTVVIVLGIDLLALTEPIARSGAGSILIIVDVIGLPVEIITMALLLSVGVLVGFALVVAHTAILGSGKRCSIRRCKARIGGISINQI